MDYYQKKHIKHDDLMKALEVIDEYQNILWHETDPRIAINPVEEGKRVGLLLWEQFSEYQRHQEKEYLRGYFYKVFTNNKKYDDPWYKSTFAFEAWHYFMKAEHDANGEPTLRYGEQVAEELGIEEEHWFRDWRRLDHETTWRRVTET
jgi:hypothetical protein